MDFRLYLSLTGSTMRSHIRRKLALLAWLLFICITSCSPAPHSVELDNSGDCPQTEESQRVVVEGYFAVAPVGTEGGYEGVHPFDRFAFSPEPGKRSMFEAGIVRANEGNNGPEVANRTTHSAGGAQTTWHIFDDQKQEIDFGTKVRVTGIMIRNCVVKVDMIEKP
ncbi:MAG: hypothetical protein QOH96_1487 [Blastocatellia bacterium]|nr:hypothetical protein [Blastocatellia bacterium]